MEARFAGPARAATLAAMLALAWSLLLRPLLAPTPVQAMGPLPACRYDDLLTSPRLYSDWPFTLVDTVLRVPGSYEPSDLVDVSQAGVPGKGRVRAIVIDDLRAMSEAAVAADAAIGVQSAYRSFDKQKKVFHDWVSLYGRPRALQVSARPGHSEHQLGLAIDFRSDPGGSPFIGNWGTTAAGTWMREHSWEFGFVMSYPKGQMSVACYDFEPWHFRYVGREMAAAINASGLTLREYLWANYTTTIVPTVTPRPGTTPGPSALPGASPTTGPSPGGSSGGSTDAPSAPATVAPPSPAAPSASTSAPTPEPTTTAVDGLSVVSLETGVVASLAIGLGGILVLAWMVLRRGRSRVGL